MNSRNYKGLPYSVYDQKTTTVNVSLFTNTKFMTTKRIYQVAIGYVKGDKGDTGSVQLKINGVLGNYSWEYYHGYGLVGVDIPLTNGMNPIITLEIVGDNDYTFKHLNGAEADVEYWYETPPINVHVSGVSVLGSKNLAEPITFTANTQGWGMLLEGGFGTICSSTNTLVIQPNEDNKSKTKIDLDVRAFAIESWDWVHNGFYNAEVLAGHSTIDGFYWKGAEIVSFAINNKSIEQDTLVNWSCANQEKWHLQVIKDEVIIHDIEQNNNLQAYTIPKSVINSTGIYTIKLQTKKIGNIALSDWSTKTIEFTISEPIIENLTQIGEYYEENITVNWRSEHQEEYEYELYQNNVAIKSGTGTTEKQFVILANTFTQTENCSVRVRVKHIYANTIKYSDWREISLTLKIIKPSIESLNLSGSNVDLPLVLSWVVTHQQNYVLEVWKEDTKLKDYTGTTDTQLTFNASTLETGLYHFKLKVAYKDRWTDYKELNATLIETLSSIGVFEPDGTIVERNEDIKVWWTSLNQSKYKLVIDGGIEYTGTTEKQVILPPATLTVGSHSMVLSVYYVTQAGLEKTPITKKAEFLVQGKPSIPTLLIDDTFNTNRPIIEWDSSDQQGYIVQVLDMQNSIIYDSDWQNGLVVQHKIMQFLADGEYTIRVKIINALSTESDWSSKKIKIDTGLKNNITLKTVNFFDHIKLSWNNENSSYILFYVFRNGKMIAKTSDTQFDDYSCNKECIYFVRGITVNDIYNDSNKVCEDVLITQGLIATIDSLSDTLNVGVQRGNWQFDGVISIENNLINLTGREYPVAIFGEHTQEQYTLKFVVKDDLFKFIDMCKRRQVFCYRDRRQTLYLSVTSPSYTIDRFGCTYNIVANTVDYREVVEYE